MKVYILTRYDYGEYKTLGVYLNRETAEIGLVLEKEDDPSYYYEIEEYEVIA